MLKAFGVGLACAGLVLPGGAIVEAEQPVPTVAHTAPVTFSPAAIRDVELDENGTLHGLVVDVDGLPVAHAVAVVRWGDREWGRAETDGLGRFAMGPLRGGTYQLSVANQRWLVRLWADATAPPAAKEMLLVVVGGTVVRGQLPLECFFASDTCVIVGLAAAMIAIPIALHGSSSPSSPP